MFEYLLLVMIALSAWYSFNETQYRFCYGTGYNNMFCSTSDYYTDSKHLREFLKMYDFPKPHSKITDACICYGTEAYKKYQRENPLLDLDNPTESLWYWLDNSNNFVY